MAEAFNDHLRVIEPHKHVENLRYRGWTLWYDAGEYQTGVCYRETKWRARSRGGKLIEHPDPGQTGDLAWLRAEIDRRTDNV